jgi:hypothetical protein
MVRWDANSAVATGTSLDNGYDRRAQFACPGQCRRQQEQVMRIVEIHERTVPISRYADPTVPTGGLTTSAVALTTDVVRNGRPVIGYGFGSIGRFGQAGLIRERFAPRLLAAGDSDLVDRADSNIDPFRAWKLMMVGEKPGGHGERCVAGNARHGIVGCRS